jgi:hypothetical protein
VTPHDQRRSFGIEERKACNRPYELCGRCWPFELPGLEVAQLAFAGEAGRPGGSLTKKEWVNVKGNQARREGPNGGGEG